MITWSPPWITGPTIHPELGIEQVVTQKTVSARIDVAKESKKRIHGGSDAKIGLVKVESESEIRE